MPNKNKRSSTTRKPAARARKKTKPRAKKQSAAPAGTAENKNAAAAVLDSQKLKDLYSAMLKCRLLAEKTRALAAEAGLDAAHAALPGYEAVLAGAAAHALPEDLIVAAYNALLAEFLRGAPLDFLLKDFLEHAPHAVPHTFSAAQSALSRSMLRTEGTKTKPGQKAMFAFCWKEESTAAAEYEAMATAAKNKLPLVCLIEINMAELAEVERRRAAQAAAMQSTGWQNQESYFPQIPVDGTDVVAVFRVVQEAVRRARGGHGPSLIQCVMPEAAERKSIHDPLAFMERYLRRRKLWSKAWRGKIEEEFRQKLEERKTHHG